MNTLKGDKINLELAEKNDLFIIKQWANDVEFVGEFEPFDQVSLDDLEKQHDGKGEGQWYFVEKKDGAKIGYIAHFKSKDCVGIGYMLVKEERGNGCGSEAVQMMVDYLFLHKNIVRVQAETHPDNKASQRVLEKAGFTLEGRIRKSYFCRGIFRDTAMYSILREEWRAPKTLPLGYVME
ncbi:MAG: GNAT family N-acetyltransferase [Thermoplasmata archaeon]|nr:GNAT family N-acetyltransferase [Thermoplasmata archaeon]